MSRTVTNNVRSNENYKMLHTFEIDFNPTPTELLLNNTFDTDLTSWTLNDPACTVIAGEAYIQDSGITQDITTTIGDTIRIEFTGRALNGDTIVVEAKDGVTVLNQETIVSLTNVTTSFIFTATSATTEIKIYTTTLGEQGNGYVDQISAKIDGVLRVTDHDTFVVYNNSLYLPLSMTFTSIKENFDLSGEGTTIEVTNLNNQIANKVLLEEWKNAPVNITRIYLGFNSFSTTQGGLAPSPSLAPSEILAPQADGQTITFDYGLGLDFTDFPKVDPDLYDTDIISLFDGFIESFSGTDERVKLKVVDELSRADKLINTRTFNQAEFQTIINTMAESILWGTA